MKKILVFFLLFSFSHTAFGADQKAISPEEYQAYLVMAPRLDSSYQRIRNIIFPKLQTPSLAECKKYFNMKDERLQLPAKAIDTEELIALFWSSIFNEDEVYGNPGYTSEMCQWLLQFVLKNAINVEP